MIESKKLSGLLTVTTCFKNEENEKRAGFSWDDDVEDEQLRIVLVIQLRSSEIFQGNTRDEKNFTDEEAKFIPLIDFGEKINKQDIVAGNSRTNFSNFEI